jgi:alkylated DNA repair dioxygenase AlkB
MMSASKTSRSMFTALRKKYPKAMKADIGAGSWIVYVPGYYESMPKDEFKAAWSSRPKKANKVLIHGKMIDEARRNRFVGTDTSISYTYSGLTQKVEPVETVPGLDKLHKVLDQDGISSASMPSLINYYKGGDEHIGFHSDDTRELVPGSHITSVSLGDDRTFVLKPKSKTPTGSLKVELRLSHGDLLIMGGNCQTTHVHSVPAESKKTPMRDHLKRINVTKRDHKKHT